MSAGSSGSLARRAVSVVIGVAIAAAALWFLLTPEAIAELNLVARTANWWLLAAALPLVAAVQWLRAWRFSTMTRGTLALPEAGYVRIAFQLNFLNFALPFRLGELGYPVLMQRAYGEPLLSSAGVLLLARLYDLATVGAILSAAAAALGIAPGWSAVLAVLAAALAIIPFALVLGARALRPMIARLPLGVAAEEVAERSHAAQLAAIALSFAIWLVFGAAAALTSAAVGEATGPTVALLGASAGNLAFALPINGIGGLGPAQAAWVAAVTQAGVAFDEAVVGALALYAVTLFSALVFGGLATAAGGRSRCA